MFFASLKLNITGYLAKTTKYAKEETEIATKIRFILEEILVNVSLDTFIAAMNYLKFDPRKPIIHRLALRDALVALGMRIE